MKDWLKPGTEVVCVDDTTDPGKIWKYGERPVVGRRYIIDAVFTDFAGKPVITCVGLHRAFSCIELGGPAGYGIFRFRPLNKRSTDTQVENLKKLLNTTPADLEGV